MSTEAYDGKVVIGIEADTKNYEQGMKRVTGSATSMGERTADAGAATEKLGEQSKKTGGELENQGKKTEDVTGSTAALVTAAAAASAAILKLGAAASEAAMAFEAAFAKTQTIMDSAAVSAKQMNGDIMSLSQSSTMAATDVSEAVYQAISGSVETAASVGFVSDANMLATAGFTSLTNATDVLTTALNAYGLSADSVSGISNVLIQTQNLGKTSVDELSSSIGRAIATGSAYGVNLQNVSTAYVELTRGGIATAEATTYLSGMLNELGKADSEVSKILREETGQSFGELMASGASLGDVLQVLSGKVNGNAEAMMGLWGSQEAAKAANAIMTMSVEDFNSVLAQMNNEMQGTTGTTASAYATMTSTSDFINRKFKNSITNLGVAFGAKLNPAIDGVKSLLTGLIEGVTEFVSDSPGVVSILTGLAVAAVIGATALGVYSVATKLATSTTWALTAAMATNPIFLAITAFVALTVAVVTFVASADDASVSVEELTEKSTALSEAVETSKQEFEDASIELQANAEVASRYAARLQELEKQTSMTDAEMAEYKMTVEAISKIMPDANLALDEQTGLLEDGAAALQTQIDLWYELAVAEALQDKMTTQIQAQAAATAELASNEAKKEMAQADLSTKTTQLSSAEKKAARTWNAYYAAEADYYKLENSGNSSGLEEKAEQMNALWNEATNLDTEIYGLNEDIAALEGDINTYDEAIAENKDTIEANATQVQEASDAYRYYMRTMEQTGESTDVTTESVRKMTDAAETLQSAYRTSYDAAYESITGQMGLFEEMSTVAASNSAMTAQAMIDALNSQVAYMVEYSDNMRKAAENGVDQSILNQLSDGSEDSARILAGLASASAEDIEKINKGFQDVAKGKEDYAGTMAEYNSETVRAKDDMVQLFDEMGIDMTDALTSQLLNGIPAYRKALAQYGIDGPSPYVGGTPSFYASGTASAAAGYAIVGEEGPELIYLRGGERILSADETRNAFETVRPYVSDSMGYIGSGSPAITGKGTVQVRATLVAPVSVDGREFARATAEYIGEEMEFGVM